MAFNSHGVEGREVGRVEEDILVVDDGDLRVVFEPLRALAARDDVDVVNPGSKGVDGSKRIPKLIAAADMFKTLNLGSAWTVSR